MRRRHTREELQELLGIAEDPPGLIALDARRSSASPAPVQAAQEHFAEWSAARAESNLAYDAWCESPGAERYLIYRAAEDRADAAEVALARTHPSGH